MFRPRTNDARFESSLGGRLFYWNSKLNMLYFQFQLIPPRITLALKLKGFSDFCLVLRHPIGN